MPTDDVETINRINRRWDALVRGDVAGTGDPDDPADVLRALVALDDAPAPDPSFAARLRASLDEAAAASPQRVGLRVVRPGLDRLLSRASWVAAAAFVVAIAGLLLAEVARDAQTTATPTAGQLAVSGTTTPPQPAETPFNSPHIGGTQAGIAPTPSVPTSAQRDAGTAVPTLSAGTVGGMGGEPAYRSLAEYVNAVDAVAIGTFGGPFELDASGTPYYELHVDEVVYGEVPTFLYVTGSFDPPEPSSRALLFLRVVDTALDSYAVHNQGLVPLADGAVVGFSFEVVEYIPRDAYAGRPVAELVAAIEALTPIEPQVEQRLARYGWTVVRKGYLWPTTLPAAADFSTSGPPRNDFPWSAYRDASTWIGLDFTHLAGADVQLLPYWLERHPHQGERLIEATFVIHDQTVVGAWVTVTGAERPFGLDERARVLAIPAALPTPVPTPTAAVPSGDTVNPAALYQLAEAAGLRLCWPYCTEDMVNPEFQVAIVAALDTMLAIAPPDAHPTPTPPADPLVATEDFIWLVFEFRDPSGANGHAVPLAYDRAAGLLLLPYDAGWVPAPPALVAAFEGVEPPPAPTKP
jgi:hypothetical protein